MWSGSERVGMRLRDLRVCVRACVSVAQLAQLAQLAHTILGPRGARWGEIGLRGRGPLEARFPTFPPPHRLRSLPPDYASGGGSQWGGGGVGGYPKIHTSK